MNHASLNNCAAMPACHSCHSPFPIFILPHLPGLGWAETTKQFATVMSLTWAASQITKVCHGSPFLLYSLYCFKLNILGSYILQEIKLDRQSVAGSSQCSMLMKHKDEALVI